MSLTTNREINKRFWTEAYLRLLPIGKIGEFNESDLVTNGMYSISVLKAAFKSGYKYMMDTGSLSETFKDTIYSTTCRKAILVAEQPYQMQAGHYGFHVSTGRWCKIKDRDVATDTFTIDTYDSDEDDKVVTYSYVDTSNVISFMGIVNDKVIKHIINEDVKIDTRILIKKPTVLEHILNSKDRAYLDHEGFYSYTHCITGVAASRSLLALVDAGYVPVQRRVDYKLL